MNLPDFVEVYDDVLDASTCAAIVARLDARPGWEDVRQILNEAVFVAFKRYLRRYPHIALAPVQMKQQDRVTGAVTYLDADRVAAADDATTGAIAMSLFRPGSINLQRYVADQGAYP